MRTASESRSRRFALAASALLVALALFVAGPSLAIPVTVSHVNVSSCDFLDVPASLDELGLAPFGFPPDEEITAGSGPAGSVACPSSGGGVGDLVSMTNVTSLDFVEVWYVSDPETTLSNIDGAINGEEAFRIDSVGLNTPLISESMTTDEIFEAGETWIFLIDDYFNTLGIPAFAFISPGAVGVGSVGPDSSGSIIAIIPEPSTAILLATGLIGIAIAGRRCRL